MLPLRLCLVALVILIHECKLSSANKYDNNIDDHQDPRIQPPLGAVPGQEFKRYVVNDPNYHYHEYKTVNKYADVPPPSAATRMARYVVHNTAWGALATISQQPRIKTFPFVNTFSVSDGPLNNGSGIPYLYLTPLDMSAQDLNQDYRSSLTMTLAETNYCDKNGFDPEDPRCAKVIFTGKIKRLKPGTPKWFFAQDALFSRHPAMQTWPAGHNWYFAKMKIEQIALLDYFGGPKFINVKEYLAAPPEVIQPIKATQV